MDEASQSWGKKLVGALTEEQIERLLDVVTTRDFGEVKRAAPGN